jgi:branched-chain amino acid transport system ATP-binding protein
VSSTTCGSRSTTEWSTACWTAWFRTKRFRKAEADIEKKSHDLLRLFDLDQKADLEASSLPYGEQRRLEIARALATGLSF